MDKNRNEILLLDDNELSEKVSLGFFKASGKGGQKRNKTSNAVRVSYEPFDVTATDCSGRSQHQNRANALQKLRLAIAYKKRVIPAQIPDVNKCAKSKKEYALFIAKTLDVYFEEGFSLKKSAEKMQVSVSSLVKRFHSDTELWQFIQEERKKNNLPPILTPK